ncbi:MAG TPA: AAA family ATPase [Parachlamydiaceae bacterium]|nr:AAA family ATPase [Parachlamydiaceae bacterium]
MTEQVRQRPYSVVLFDEIEKAHPDVMNILLQILEEGRLTDSFGRKIDFRNTIIILTSNLGADLIRKQTEVGFGASESTLDYERMKEKIESEAKKYFKPEFLNRLDDRVYFHTLDKPAVLNIIDLLLSKVQLRLQKREVYIKLDDAAKEFIIEKGYVPEMGARPLRRTIEEYVEGPLAEILLEHPDEGRRCLVTVEDGKLKFVDQDVFPVEKLSKKPPSSSTPAPAA